MVRSPLETALQPAVEGIVAGLESLPETPRPVRRWGAVGFSLAILSVLLLGALLVQLLFVRPDAFNEWFAFKPGMLVEMTTESGKLQVEAFQEPTSWYEWSANFHSSRWAATLLFTGLRYVTGLDMRMLSVAPFGIVVYLLALLFLFHSADQGAAGRWGFLLSALLLLFSWPMLGWVFHSGCWPSATMVLFSFGLLFQASRRHRYQVWLRAMALLFLFLAFGYYHAMAVLLTFLLPVLFVYQAVVSLASHLRGQPAPAPAFSYSNLAAIVVVWFFLDPLFTLLVGETAITRPWEGMTNFYSSVFQRAGDVASYQTGYSFAGRILLMLPLVALFLAAAWLWARSHLFALVRGRALNEGQIISGAFCLAVPFLSIGAIVAGAGAFRYPEAYFLLLLAAPLMLVQWLFSRSRLTRGVLMEGTVVAVSLLIITFISFPVLAREPISKWGRLQESDLSVADWSARNIQEPYFADNFTSGLILLENHESPIVSLQGSTTELGEALYNGVAPFAQALRDEGAALALLSGRSVASSSPEEDFRTLKTTEYFIQPIPNYDFGVPPYGRVYDDGRNTVITLGPSP
jgi:hypothetical protein